MQISLTRPSDKDRPVRAAWGRGKVAWGGVGLSRVEYHGTDAQASLGCVGPVRAAWGRGKVAWGRLSRVEYHGTDAEASLTSGRRPSGVGGYIYIYIYLFMCVCVRIHNAYTHTPHTHVVRDSRHVLSCSLSRAPRHMPLELLTRTATS